METLPDDLLPSIFTHLPSSDKLSTALSCRRFLAALHKKLPDASSIVILFAEKSCSAAIKGRDEATLTVCQCPLHGCTNMLYSVLPAISARVDSLSLEDELREESLNDVSLHALLNGCSGAPLSFLSFQHVDFSSVHPWTLALIASFDRLEQVHVLGCLLQETLLLRSLSSSMHSLRLLSVTESRLATDKLCSTLSRSAPNLEEVNVRGCVNVTAFSVISLMESAMRRRNDSLTLHLEETSFDSQQLQRCLSSSLMPTGKEWKVSRMHMEIGFLVPLLLLSHPSGKVIMVFD